MVNIIRWFLVLFKKKRKPVVDIQFLKDIKQLQEIAQPPPPTKPKFILRWGNKFPPRSMTQREKFYYDIKPNLQYWVERGAI